MAKGIIRRRMDPALIGQWEATRNGITVETDDPELRRAADQVLSTPILIPHKPPERFVPAGPEEAAYEPLAKLKYLALFALEMEARGFEIEPEYD